MIKIIAVAYERAIPLRILIDCFLVQTSPNWELYIIHDGYPPSPVQDIINLYSDDRIKFVCSEKRYGQYGHPNRRQLLEKMTGTYEDFILMTNDDNYYVPLYIEYMLQQATRLVGIVSCNTVHSHFQYKMHESKLAQNHIDMGAFIVRFPIAKAVGFKYNDFGADGKYAVECANACRANNLEVIHIDKPLFVHN